jgi:hypothetical protein
MFENRIKAQTNKELENSKGFSHDKIVQLLRLGAARANVHKAISGEITYEHRFRKIDRNSSTYSPVYQTQAGENAEGLGVGPDGQASRVRQLAP